MRKARLSRELKRWSRRHEERHEDWRSLCLRRKGERKTVNAKTRRRRRCAKIAVRAANRPRCGSALRSVQNTPSGGAASVTILKILRNSEAQTKWVNNFQKSAV